MGIGEQPARISQKCRERITDETQVNCGGTHFQSGNGYDHRAGTINLIIENHTQARLRVHRFVIPRLLGEQVQVDSQSIANIAQCSLF